MWDEPKRTRVRVSEYEAQDKNGHWVREFTSRIEPWPIIEHWASENGFHLVAMKSGRRAYTRGERLSGRVTIVDVRCRDRSVRVSAWIQVGWLFRLFTLFRLGANQELVETGWAGVRLRRQMAHAMNGLLFRFRQRPIGGTVGWHIADLPGTSLSVLGASLVLFISSTAFLLSFFPGQLEAAFSLLPALTTPAIVFATVSLVLFCVQHFAFAKREMLPRLQISAAAVAVFALMLTAGSVTFRTASTLRKQRASHFCLLRSKGPDCAGAVAKLTEPEREEVLAFLSTTRKSIAGRAVGRERSTDVR